MPELPDVTVYVEHLAARTIGQPLRAVHIRSPFLLRTFDPPIEVALGRTVDRVSRLGKRIVLSLSGDLHLVFHLMIAGRFRWQAPGERKSAKIELARFDFPSGVLCLTEAAGQKRAALHVVAGCKALAAHDPGGLDVFSANAATFAAVLRSERHTLKRALTDPRLLSGIGNAYSDEILHAARLSPVALTTSLSESQLADLHRACRETLERWTQRLRVQFADHFPGPGEITAFRPDFAVHGRYGLPCPVCSAPVQRIRYATNETNYCAACQTGGRILADRSLSRLLRDDWPRSIEELM